MRGSHANLAPVDKCSDMLRTHRVMTVFADNRDRFFGGNPVIAHVGISLSGRTFKFPVGWVMGRS